MEQKYLPIVDGAPPQIIHLILVDLDLARADTTRSYTIEQIVEGVIRHECFPK
jgi:hypothetical protein